MGLGGSPGAAPEPKTTSKSTLNADKMEAECRGNTWKTYTQIHRKLIEQRIENVNKKRTENLQKTNRTRIETFTENI